jgi:uncharacterized repeat protein (TIGR01451 family)
MNVDAVSGLLTWTPTEAQRPSTNQVTVQVAASTNPSARTLHSFTVTVNEVNSPPALALIPNQTVAEGGTLALTIKATDPDLPPNKLTFSIVSGPIGATIDPTSGLVTWTPAPGQGVNVITVRVTDDGTPPLSDTKSFRVTVTQQLPTDLQVQSTTTTNSVILGAPFQYSLVVSNRGPAAAAGVVLTDKTPPGATVISAATTQGSPLVTLTETVFSIGYLDVGANATLTLTVTPTAIGMLTNEFVLTSTSPEIDPANNTLVELTQVLTPEGPALTVSFAAGQLALGWPSSAVGYHLESTDTLQGNSGWAPVSTVPITSGGKFLVTEAASTSKRFYRLSNQ